jgi:hypothetical protein
VLRRIQGLDGVSGTEVFEIAGIAKHVYTCARLV